ncbi:HD domain-containing protein [Psychrobacillus lasiicapitis]|uniref:HD domain-containing protein n=1 Tax=Psychrobacillus lasiicapitis TaxID=1636719 RepID=A0A544THD9_9BACI|nr:HD domain-containing protein [Psychrobacillus lasiicapitis]TQR16831.1 HD domain-containing protein [Psychrobacillus lasiicapitis]GGA26785.1 phosphohydrolase [Psychrobacillus lasiicapitis]
MNPIHKCEQLVKEVYKHFDASHDFQHIERVRKNAFEIAASEPTADLEIIELAVLLHDVSDPKYATVEEKQEEDRIIKQLSLPTERVIQLKTLIKSISFNGGNETAADSIEAQIVRDADRLDAIGAVGIARTFAYGGAKGRKLYDSDETPRDNMSIEEYRSKETASVTHFYEKLLKLADGMLTEKGKELAKERHAFMELFLQNLRKETGEQI